MQVKDVVYLRLRDHIVDLTFAPGSSLREAALSELFGVSKTPIREALVRLEREGLVEVAPYRGARVREYTPEAIREIFDARGILEAECVRRAAEFREPLVLTALRTNTDNTRRALAVGDEKATAAALDEFDEILFRVLSNKLLAEVFDRLTLHLKRIGKIGASIERFGESLEFHEAIVTAIEEGDTRTAMATMRLHIASVRDVTEANAEATPLVSVSS